MEYRLPSLRTFAQPAAAAEGSPSGIEEELVRTTMRWLRDLDFDLGDAKFSIDDFCTAISVFLSRSATCLDELQPVTGAQILRLCGTWVQKSADGSELELVDSSATPKAMTGEVPAEMALACLRFLNLSDWSPEPKEFRPQQRVILHRNTAYPFYQLAAKYLVRSLDVAPEPIKGALVDEACRLFASARSGNFQSWLVALATSMFPDIPETAQASLFINLLQVLAKSASPLHIAACLGLVCVCRALIRKGCDVNLQSKMGSPLYCAVAGPSLLGCFFRGYGWNYCRSRTLDSAQKETARVLVDAGAVIQVEKPFGLCRGPSYASAALMASANLRDLDFLTSLCLRDHYLDDEDFLHTLEDPNFPFLDSGDFEEESLKYLNDLCALLIDQSWRRCFHKIWRAAWRKAANHTLGCISIATKRPLMLSDADLAEYHMDACTSRTSAVYFYVLRMIQDGQREANWVTDFGEANGGQTVLHDAVETQNTRVLELLLEHGRVDLSVRDRQGRTPLHLCEGGGATLKILLRYGADLSSADNEGRTIWHFAAANNDIKLLKALAKVDPDRFMALRRTTQMGRTPLAEAFAYVRELVGVSEETDTGDTVPRSHLESILYLLKYCKADPAYLRSDIPILCYAAEWGSCFLLGRLLKCHSTFDLTASDGSNPLHFLNVSASREFILAIRAIPGIAELPALNEAGQTPAETIFLAFKPDTKTFDQTAHPSTRKRLDAAAYKELLTEPVRSSKDQQGRTLWERFCHDIIAHYAQRESFNDHVGDLLHMACRSFIECGVIRKHENSGRSSCPFVALTRAISNVRPPMCSHWLAGILDCLLSFLHGRRGWDGIAQYLGLRLTDGTLVKTLDESEDDVDGHLKGEPSVVWTVHWIASYARAVQRGDRTWTTR